MSKLVICKGKKKFNCDDCSHSVPHREYDDCTLIKCSDERCLCCVPYIHSWSKKEDKSLESIGFAKDTHYTSFISWEEIAIIINKRHDTVRTADACRHRYNLLFT